MDDKEYRRLVQTSVTVFLYHEDDFLFLKRNLKKRIDPGRLNGVGGRLEAHENYLDTAIRETEEETGYKVAIEDVQFRGMMKLEGGYDEDWVIGFFKIKVPSKTIPIGNVTEEDGELIWLPKEQILESEYELVDDLNYCIQELIGGKEIFFINARVGDDQKIIHANISKLQFVQE